MFRGRGKRGAARGGHFEPPRSQGERPNGSSRGFWGQPSRSQSANRGRGHFTNNARLSSVSQGQGQENRAGRQDGVSASRDSRGGYRQSLKDRTDGNCASGQRQSNKKVIGYQKLQSWASETSPSQLILWMSNESDALTDLMTGTNIKPDWYRLLVKIGSRITSVGHQKQALKKVLTVYITSHFLDQSLFKFVSERKQRAWPDAKEFYEEIFAILKEIINLLPQFANECQMPLSLLQSMVLDMRELSEDNDLIQTISDLREVVKKVNEENKQSQVNRRRAVPYSDTDTPPEDFRELSVMPDASDLRKNSLPFVRAILSKGSYRDQAHYLDIQFRLMREDFVQPLREGLLEFKRNGCKKDYKPSDLRLYFDVHIIGMTTVNGINHVLQFDVKPLKSINWEHSKRFLNGSLLCLSKDDFETVFFATVAFRNPNDLKEGIINVEFRSGLEAIFCSPSTDSFVMAETTAYYEAYYPILEGLKELDSSASLQKYFIHCQDTLKPPGYLLGGVRQYDLASITKSEISTKVPVLNTMSWPKVEELNVNESQRAAVQLALTKELAIIQGPPGTGKTYVGLKVMKVLLENRKNMAVNQDSHHDPILVLCYTNHALDQFLEGIVQFCPTGVVRVGGRSSSKVMEALNLKSLKKDRATQLSERRALFSKRIELDNISHEIDRLKSKIDSLYTEVQKEDHLQQYMLPEHYDTIQNQFFDSFSNKKDFQIRRWLNVSKKLSRDSLPNLIKNRLTSLVLQVKKQSFIHEEVDVKKSIKNMHVIERASVYQGWLNAFHLSLDLKIFEHRHIFEESKTRILSDSEMRYVIPSKVFILIYSMNHSVEIDAVENWILGLNNSLNDQLNDVESLLQFIHENDGNSDDDCDDAFGGGDSQESRLIDVDHCEEEEIAKATLKIKEGDAFLLLKAEELGIGNVSEDDNGENEWQTVSYKKPLTFSKLRYYLTTIEPMTEEEERRVDNVWNLDIKKRFALYNLWLQRYRSKIAEKMERLVFEYKEALAGKKEIRMEGDIEILKHSQVIGMTTTGAAKNRAILQAVACRIIVVEEAAEVLEAHIITSLNKSCKHLILIGDHQQLKPNPTVYALAKNYHLDLSLFERLINNGIQHVTLKEQHRMRVSISKIMRHIYPHLQDHISVTKYENIQGVGKNIFFINHEKHESEVNDAKSKSNAHEASYLVALLRYFLLQGYKPSQITILATYVGQVFLLRKELKVKHLLDGVRVTTVDNFQGEENDIILLSLVRSNARSNVGFLKVDNRVCVALSRAKKGLFAVGNFKMLSSQSELWAKIMETAELDGIYGDALPVVCPNHPTFKIDISLPGEFEKNCPEGGCGRQCEFRLQCGHTCPLKCHGYDSKHEKVKCTKTCSRSCPHGHPCRKRCVQKCGDCMEIVEKKIPRCGHKDKIPCYMPITKAVCSQTCSVPLECGHNCTGKCGECDRDKKHAKCQMLQEYFWPCDHICKVPCYMKPKEFPCPKKCEAVLECGHKCKGTCSDCVEGMMHIACQVPCPKLLPCGHQCSSMCSIPCPPCPKVCCDACVHSKCEKNGHACGDNCIPCQEPCRNGCEHKKCSKKCFEECDIVPCKMRCIKSVKKCKHLCSGLCGEICVCALCDPVFLIPKISKKISSFEISEQDGAFSQNEEPVENETSRNAETADFPLLIKVPSCGHIFYLNELDAYVESLQEDEYAFCLPCPICKKAIQNCFHYSNVVKGKTIRREEQKQKIRQLHQISAGQIYDLERSQRIVMDTDLHGIWDTITKVKIENLLTRHEVISLNLKYRYAYVLSDLKLFESQLTSGEPEVIHRIRAVQKLRKNITQQQKTNFKAELEYLLLDFYVKKLEENCNGAIHAESLRLCKKAKKALKERKEQRPALRTMLSIIDAVEKDFEKSIAFTVSLRTVKKAVYRDLKILVSKENQMLSEILMK